MSKEIVMAGVKYNNKVYDGFNHGECFKKLPTEANMVNVEQGFITNDGEFVDREKAFTIARKANQLEYDYGTQKILISEDIHINWLHKKDQKMADLEAKLAELREQITICDEENSKTFMKSVNAWRENAELKQQLAESEEKINMLEEHKFYADNIIQAYADKCKKANQDKISFAVEQLKKVKGYFGELSLYEMYDKIDNQIKQLKEQK